ncbi:MAG: hypothetical protein UT43_C0017G0006 [Parcubacteria group bacterium GW2011_GWC1_39_29]|uniref:Uncharacterized protein n=1 Tax=Candidatus Yanofskybacteria bacterium GW2011_GWD1_39_16 TaxID=1619030 RepID=A0A837HSI8_9BACT|nr:MAG: hypothetical protein UT35_C0002G0005 [Candidatus Yanofskybacteria bacterium GW2011_GWD1_39_16]KKR14735.1 MAG: hypothetical protein UT43_C0017G0006 [Parcubacteria group bacterium GW2011_GWC1_39_29]
MNEDEKEEEKEDKEYEEEIKDAIDTEDLGAKADYEYTKEKDESVMSK